MFSDAEYYSHLAIAYVHGSASTSENGEKGELKVSRFKRSNGELPRVKRVLGMLRGVQFDTLLDVGSGRGAFLLPFLDEFTDKRVTSIDVLSYRVEFYNAMHLGGIENLTAFQSDITALPFEDNSFDVVTMLEVLEHIPDVQAAVSSAVRAAEKCVIVSVPANEDNNPEHIHLLTKKRLTELFENAGCTRLHFDGVNNHLIMMAITES